MWSISTRNHLALYIARCHEEHSPHLNDYNEFEYGRNKIRRVGLQLSKDLHSPELANAIDQAHKFLEGGSVGRWASFPNSRDAYVACFSQAEDDVNQWIKYGDGGQGVALGYDATHMQIGDGCTGNIYADPYIVKVIYEPADQEKIIQQILTHIDQQVKQQNTPQVYPELIAIVAEAIAPVFKESTWSSEQEVRLIKLRKRPVDADQEKIQQHAVHFRPSATHLIPYIELVFGTESGLPRPITRIYNGPKADQKIAFDTIDMYLATIENNRGIVIETSRVSLR